MINISKYNFSRLNKKYNRLSDLENDYLQKFRVYSQPEKLLDIEILGKKNEAQTDAIMQEIEILEYLKSEFSNIIKGTPDKLNSYIEHFKEKKWDEIVYDSKNKKTTSFGEELIEIYGYGNRFRDNVNRGLWLAQQLNQLNYKACPYCNAQYTIITTKESDRLIAKFQFDHFFPKSRYPYLSISLYNLIPSCANCNVTKSAKELSLDKHHHPYFMSIGDYAKFKLKYDPDPSKVTVNNIKNQDFEIQFIPIKENDTDAKEKVEAHDKLYHITGIYNCHQDIVEDLFTLAVIYKQNLAESHLKIEGLFPDKSMYYRYLLRNYHLEADVLKRPFSKLTQDIARQLGLIK